MSLIILFASILIEGKTKSLSYNPALFKTYGELGVTCPKKMISFWRRWKGIFKSFIQMALSYT